MAKFLTISKFKERPKTRAAWWAMGLGLGAFCSGPILGLFASVVQPFIIENTTEGIAQLVGFIVGGSVLAMVIVALAISIHAFRKGERSWVVWVGLVPSSVAVAFWLLMLIGEFVFPH